MKKHRITLNWKKLFAFEQVERRSDDSRISGRLGEKIGGKDCQRPAADA